MGKTIAIYNYSSNRAKNYMQNRRVNSPIGNKTLKRRNDSMSEVYKKRNEKKLMSKMDEIIRKVERMNEKEKDDRVI